MVTISPLILKFGPDRNKEKKSFCKLSAPNKSTAVFHFNEMVTVEDFNYTLTQKPVEPPCAVYLFVNSTIGK